MKRKIALLFLACAFLGAGELNSEQKAEFDTIMSDLEQNLQNQKEDPQNAFRIEQYYMVDLIKLFKLAILADNENTFKTALQKASGYDLNELVNVEGEYDFAKDLVEKQRLNLLKELGKSKFDFKKAELLQYARKIKANDEIIKLLSELEK